jgi:hypothetical protein
MTGEEQLNKISFFKEKIREQEYYIKELEQILLGVKGLSYDKESVQTSVDGDGLLNKLADLEKERQILQKYKLSYMKQKIRMIQMIHKMEIGNRQTLLYRMYIKEQSLEKCAQYMEWTPEYTRKQHRIALKEFNEIVRSMSG